MAMLHINLRPGPKQLRQFAAIAAGVVPLVMWLWGFALNSILLGGLAGALFGLLSFFFPVIAWPTYVLLTLCAAPIGWIVGELALLVVFFGVFMPVGLLLRCLKRDLLQLKLDSRATSYWSKKDAPVSPASYYRQF